MPTVKYDVDLSDVPIEVEVQVWCSGCGAGLCGDARARNHEGIEVEPCEKCLQNAEDAGYQKAEDKHENHP